MSPTRDFEAEVERALADLKRRRFEAVHSLREIEESWARALLGLSDDHDLTKLVSRWVQKGGDSTVATQANAHLHESERWQWEIGTYSTGSGEGLASMAEVRKLQAAQAWLRAAVGDAVGARALIDEIERDPNGMGQWEARSMRKLRERLDTPAGPGTP